MSTDPASGPDLHLVQLGPIEIDPIVLEGAGTSLWELIGDRHVQMTAADDVLDLPRHGWRRIAASHADAAHTSEVFAAPHGRTPDTWRLVSLTHGEGTWIISTHPRPLRIHRCRAARRAGLELHWPADYTCPVGTLPEMTIDLVNTTDTRWINEAGDHMTVHGWVLDEKGTPMKPELVLFSHAPQLPDLAPAERIPLRVTIATRDIDTFPPGRYALIAELHDLTLTSPAGTLQLYNPPTAPE